MLCKMNALAIAPVTSNTAVELGADLFLIALHYFAFLCALAYVFYVIRFEMTGPWKGQNTNNFFFFLSLLSIALHLPAIR